MATRLLSFLGDVEQALLRKSASATSSSSWQVSCMVNYHHGLARMTLTPGSEANETQARGAIFLQTAVLTDGSSSVKASFNWHGSDAFPVITLAARTPFDWKSGAVRIARA